MALIERFLERIVRGGRLTLLMPGGKRLEFGPGGGESPTGRPPSPSPATRASALARPIWTSA
jgi:hypothetical protein